MSDADERPIKRRLRQPLSCQRCRKQRSKCSRDRPTCKQCQTANVPCEYLDAPGDLASTALRDRFSTLHGQIDSLLSEFGLIEQLVYNRDPAIRTDALRSWHISNDTGIGVSIDTHMHHVEDIYAVLLQFARDNDNSSTVTPSSSTSSSSSSTTRNNNLWLTRNNTIYPTIKLSHFTSLLPATAATSPDNALSPTPSLASAPDHENALNRDTVQWLLHLYPTCLLHGSILGFEPVMEKLVRINEHKKLNKTPILRLLYTSCMCYMLLHACYWHPIESITSTTDTVALAQSYYDEAKELVSSLYFEQETPSVLICHAICNLVLYHIESGNTSVIYLYSGMAARLAASLDIPTSDNEEENVYLLSSSSSSTCQEGDNMVSVVLEPSYIRSIRWFLHSLDTAASHFHNKPYEVQLYNEDGPPYPDTSDSHNLDYQQRIFQWLEYRTCEITRDIRRTCFSNDRQQVPYKEIERIEQKLRLFQTYLLRYTYDTNDDQTENYDSNNNNDDNVLLWKRRCKYMHSIRYYGHWILLHQTYLPTPLSVERCSKAAFALVDLFDVWQLDCYFRPCIHELKQACEILEYLVDHQPNEKQKALDALSRLLGVILGTPVHDIARTRPFIQRVQHILALHHQ
ncbi:hypothetical protein BDB00DRAFT_839509 [Zychaea mexicana]|uniref:uncharacterized protein n=1 Tax=Zychaea mexicana TaxID=64656 RepID=UPI0022FE080B|nr:uncharacterized protein BDB00DRAFT_839509 [Zychaea mexicana]KAI9490079.1 hypothetical protein BDB00DRAFT_839509 [Zychaea mexicana]